MTISKVVMGVLIALVAFAGGWFLHIKNPEILKNFGAVSELRPGVYQLIGTSPTGQQYEGNIVIERSGMIYDLTWYIGDQQVQQGVGILNRGVLSVGYIDVTGDTINDAGAVSYVLKSSEELVGTWASTQGGSIGIETLWWVEDMQ